MLQFFILASKRAFLLCLNNIRGPGGWETYIYIYIIIEYYYYFMSSSAWYDEMVNSEYNYKLYTWVLFFFGLNIHGSLIINLVSEWIVWIIMEWGNEYKRRRHATCIQTNTMSKQADPLYMLKHGPKEVLNDDDLILVISITII